MMRLKFQSYTTARRTLEIRVDLFYMRRGEMKWQM